MMYGLMDNIEVTTSEVGSNMSTVPFALNTTDSIFEFSRSPIVSNSTDAVDLVYETEPSSETLHIMWFVLAAIGGAVVAIIAAPIIVMIFGFGLGGIVRGSIAASTMSCMERGETSSGGMVATCQSIGASGTVLKSRVATIITGTIGAAVGLWIAHARMS